MSEFKSVLDELVADAPVRERVGATCRSVPDDLGTSDRRGHGRRHHTHDRRTSRGDRRQPVLGLLGGGTPVSTEDSQRTSCM